MSKGLEELRKLCSECESHLAINKKCCPFRSISNEYCTEYEKVKKELKKPQELYNFIKQKCANAQFDYENDLIDNELDKEYIGGQLCAYNDILSLIESMFEVEEDGK